MNVEREAFVRFFKGVNVHTVTHAAIRPLSFGKKVDRKKLVEIIAHGDDSCPQPRNLAQRDTVLSEECQIKVPRWIVCAQTRMISTQR
jgi:hypothetical protein